MATDTFYATLPRVRDFTSLSAPDAFAPLPADWHLCCTDIVNSTGLVAEGRYKTVNMIGAAVIAAMRNALQGEAFPYIFGGDGASFAVPPRHADTAKQVLATLRSWTEAEYGVALRAAMLPLSWIRADGLDVRIARLCRVRTRRFRHVQRRRPRLGRSTDESRRVRSATCRARRPPDLSGLSCRWSNTPARNGLILSVVARAGTRGKPARLCWFLRGTA